MRRSPLRKQSKNTISKLKKKLDAVFSLFIRNRDNWTCFTCGKKSKEGMQNGHFISRSHNSTRYDEINNHAQCIGCNVFKNGNSAEYAYRLIQKYGQEEFEALIKRGRQTKQFTVKELEQLIHEYETANSNLSPDVALGPRI